MQLIIVVDDNMGMMFNHRRQSKDVELRKDILSLTGSNKLLVSQYTAKQFENSSLIIVDDNCLENAKENDFVFVEDLDITQYVDKVDKIHLYRWNRVYPHDVVFPISLNNWHCSETRTFVGKSHEEISYECYERD